MKFLLSASFVVLVALAITYALNSKNEPENQASQRWYTETQSALGKRVYEKNCTVCHGSQGQGLTENWKQPLADGSYPPPPLNGTAHTWHHPASQLLRTINNGGISQGGKMPGFDSQLTDENKIAVIAYFQNWWSDDIYDAWIARNGMDI